MKQSQSGFTLIELMIAVAIVGIGAAIAYPNYQDSVIKSHRAEAKAALMEIVNFMERQATLNGCYLNPGADGRCGTDDDIPPTLPFLAVPKGSSPTESPGRVVYLLNFVQVDASSFTLMADPSSDSSQINDPCGQLWITNTGIKSNVGSLPSSECW
jgi:type IV pilus assembly protein PilE